MQIQSLVKPEIDMYISLCNFTDDERAYFLCKTLGEMDVAIAFKLSVSTSTVTRIGRRVKAKMVKVGGAQ